MNRPSILRSSDSPVAVTPREALNALEKKVDEYLTRLRHLEYTMQDLLEEFTEVRYTQCWDPSLCSPRVTPQMREMMIWRQNNPSVKEEKVNK